MSAPAPIFNLQAQSLGWGQQGVLDSLNLNIVEGEKIAIVGKSGSGKTTLIRALHQQAPEKVALCGQEYGLVPSLSVFHNIYMGQLDKHHFIYNFANLLRPFKKEIDAVTSLTNQLELTDALFKSAEKLSGGQQQRVALGRTLFQNKTIFIGDEPVSSVDEVQAEKLIQFIMARHQTTILTLHNVDLALRFCDRIIGLRHGVIELDSPVKDISSAQIKSLYQD